MAQPQVIVSPTMPHSSPAMPQPLRTRLASYPIAVSQKINWSYFKTTLGIMKIIQLAFAIACMVCFEGHLVFDTGFLSFVVYSCFVVTVTFAVAQLFSFQKIWPKIPFLYVELVYTIIGTILYFVAGISQFAMTMQYKDNPYVIITAKHRTLVAFTILNVVAYALSNVFVVFKIKKTNEEAAMVQPVVNPSVA